MGGVLPSVCLLVLGTLTCEQASWAQSEVLIQRDEAVLESDSRVDISARHGLSEKQCGENYNINYTESPERVQKVQTSTCQCYCGGMNWSLGATACLGGFKKVCADNPCGWADLSSPNNPCTGSENCK